MDTRHLVDPELVPVLDQFPAFQLTTEILPQARTLSAQWFASMQPSVSAAADRGLPAITVEERRVPGPAGAPDVRVLVYRPPGTVRPLPALLWVHGGGYVLGSADEDDPLAKRIVDAVGCAVVSVDYRLAPETPFPGPVDDCYAALSWLHANAAELEVDPNRLAIGGASGGGGLAAGLGLLTRDRGAVPLVFQLLIYPMIDDRTVTTTDPNPYTGEFIWTRDSNRFGWTSYLGQEPGGPDVSPHAAAARAESLEGLPSTYLCAGALDLFLDETLEYARRLTRAGVPTELHVYPGAYHGFNIVTDARVSHAFARDYLDALGRALGQEGQPTGDAPRT
jgi:acetyl esterase/lipase